MSQEVRQNRVQVSTTTPGGDGGHRVSTLRGGCLTLLVMWLGLAAHPIGLAQPLAAQAVGTRDSDNVGQVLGKIGATAGVSVLTMAATITLRYRIEPLFEKPWRGANLATVLLPAAGAAVVTIWSAAEISGRGRFTDATFAAAAGALAGGAVATGVASMFGADPTAKLASGVIGVGFGALGGFLLGGLALESRSGQDESANVPLVRLAFRF